VGHAVLAVGYGIDDESGVEYVTIKNSWGTTWGDNGFGKISLSNEYSKNGICGVLTDGFWVQVVAP
jgi:C1A family cysteine protease